jgi:hypothetical protein
MSFHVGSNITTPSSESSSQLVGRVDADECDQQVTNELDVPIAQTDSAPDLFKRPDLAGH